MTFQENGSGCNTVMVKLRDGRTLDFDFGEWESVTVTAWGDWEGCGMHIGMRNAAAALEPAWAAYSGRFEDDMAADEAATPKHPAPPPWTPGPRRVRFESYGAKVIAEDGTPLGWHGRNGGMSLAQAHANAILDAAGPELVSELHRLVDALEPLERDGRWPLDHAGIATLNGARAALAKARGG